MEFKDGICFSSVMVDSFWHRDLFLSHGAQILDGSMPNCQIG